MAKRVFIAEKPSVAQEFARILKVNGRRGDGYLESEDTIVTWCVGHLVTMSYPEVYDAALKKWSLDTLPFLPEKFLYEVIPGVKKQFDTVSYLLNREDVDTIYICTDSGREGEYIYRLVDQMAQVSANKKKLRVWIDSQTEEEILRGIREAKPMAEYDNISSSAYLRAKEDYLMGINFSRVLSLKYGFWLNDTLKGQKWTSVSVGRVMTCVLGMVVKREMQIRDFVKTPFYRVIGNFELQGKKFQGEWKAVEGSKYYQSPALYKENGFKEKENALALIDSLMQPEPVYRAYKDLTKNMKKKPRVVYLTPQGTTFHQEMAKELAKEEELVFLCGHYEGIDERVLEEIVTDYVSIGDYVLTGGELPAMVMIDSISRLVPGVLHNDDSAGDESFENGLLEYPQYTRPPVFLDKEVPEVLLSGHHENIRKWRHEQSVKRTKERRPDLWKAYEKEMEENNGNK